VYELAVFFEHNLERNDTYHKIHCVVNQYLHNLSNTHLIKPGLFYKSNGILCS